MQSMCQRISLDREHVAEFLNCSRNHGCANQIELIRKISCFYPEDISGPPHQHVCKNRQRVPPLDDASYRLQDAKNFFLRCFENNHVNPFKTNITTANESSH